MKQVVIFRTIFTNFRLKKKKLLAALYSGGAKTPMGRVDVHEVPVEQEVLIVHWQGDLLSCYAAIWENRKSGLFSKDVPNS